MKVKIIKASGSLFWYARFVGETFDVIGVHGNDFEVGGKRYIVPEDCIIVAPEPEIPQDLIEWTPRWKPGSQPPSISQFVLMYYSEFIVSEVIGFHQTGKWHSLGGEIANTPNFWTNLP